MTDEELGGADLRLDARGGIDDKRDRTEANDGTTTATRFDDQ